MLGRRRGIMGTISGGRLQMRKRSITLSHLAGVHGEYAAKRIAGLTATLSLANASLTLPDWLSPAHIWSESEEGGGLCTEMGENL